MPMALEGIRIIDMTIWQHGPVSTCMLADMGTEVIKIEARGYSWDEVGSLKEKQVI